MTPVSRWAVRRPWLAILTWVGIFIVVIVLGTKFGGVLNNSFDLPNTESTKAGKLLDQVPATSSEASGATAKIVFSPSTGTVNDPTVQAQMESVAKKVASLPTVACVQSPYGDPIGTACPKQQAAPPVPAGQKAPVIPNLSVSPDKSVAFYTVSFKGAAEDVPVDEVKTLVSAIKAANGVKLANGTTVTVGANGFVLDNAADPPSSEGIGVLVALIILLFAFGSIVGAFLPILSAVIGLASGLILVNFAARFLDVAVFAPTLATLIGLGVGIDYSLFVINRYRQALEGGREPKAAALESVQTAGRAVQFAAATVIIALLGMFVLRINFFNGLAVACAVTVFMVMLGALLLLPALLSLLGKRVFGGRMPSVSASRSLGGLPSTNAAPRVIGVGFRWLFWILLLPVTLIGFAWRKISEARHGGDVAVKHTGFARYGNWLHKRKWLTAGVSLVAMLIIALPAFTMRQGFADDGGKAPGTPQRIAFDLLSDGFGPGYNGPFFVAVQLPQPGDAAGEVALINAFKADPGIASTFPTAELAPLFLDPATSITAIQVTPTTAPQDQATADTLIRLRTSVIPPVVAATGVQAYIGGSQAITQDFTKVLTDALPIVELVVVGLGLIALMILFRSILVPLVGVLSSLLSFGAAMGVTVLVFQEGHAASFLGVDATGPIAPFVPCMVFAIVFGLSMDYQVFLVSRMQEEWAHTHNNAVSIRRGLAGSGRVVAIAAAIMASVFASFILGDDSTIKLFGVALSTAIIFDAFVIRLVLVPSVMAIIGDPNWWLPGWLNKIIPHFEIESDDEMIPVDDIEEDDPDTSKKVGASV